MANPFRKYEDGNAKGSEDGRKAAGAYDIEAVYDEFLEAIEKRESGDHPEGLIFESIYDIADGLLEGGRYSADGIASFMPLLKGGKTEYAGVFISAIVNRADEEEVTLELSRLERLSHVGFGLKDKRLIIKGDVGWSLGYGMESGELTVEGNAGTLAGEEMRGGKMTIKGNAKSWLGRNMTGGELYVEGKISMISPQLKGGKVFEGGRRVYG